MTIYYLTCADDTEAQTVVQALLEKKLVACVRRMPVSSSYWWGGNIQHDDEILLMMESTEEKFNEIEKTIAKLHSYATFALTAVPITKTTPGVLRWLNATLG